jgi:hypothetical protein
MVWEPYYDPLCRNILHVAAFGGLKIFKMAAVAMVTKVQNGHQIQKSFDLGEIWFPSRLWCCELIFIVGLLWCSELDETFQKLCLTCEHIILRLRNFRMAAVARIGWNLIEMLYENGFNCLPSSTTPVMEMLEDYIISMKSNAKDVGHTLLY